jgi:hypothetical protein
VRASREQQAAESDFDRPESDEVVPRRAAAKHEAADGDRKNHPL